jgi:hypothetical protein
MWQMKQEMLYEQQVIKELLASGWEPYAAVTINEDGEQVMVMFRRFLNVSSG